LLFGLRLYNSLLALTEREGMFYKQQCRADFIPDTATLGGYGHLSDLLSPLNAPIIPIVCPLLLAWCCLFSDLESPLSGHAPVTFVCPFSHLSSTIHRRFVEMLLFLLVLIGLLSFPL
jgi:hypothetical protein